MEDHGNSQEFDSVMTTCHGGCYPLVWMALGLVGRAVDDLLKVSPLAATLDQELFASQDAFIHAIYRRAKQDVEAATD